MILPAFDSELMRAPYGFFSFGGEIVKGRHRK